MNAQRIQVPPTLTGVALGELDAAVSAALASPESRVLALYGSRDVFCLGADFRGLLDGESIEREADGFAALLERILTSPKPVIAAVEGRAAAGGVGLLAAADLVVASETTEFALTEALFGVVPAIIAPVLLRRISPAKATLWTASGQTWSAAEALSAGLADVVVPQGSMAATIGSWSRRLGRADQEALGAFKKHLRAASPLQPADGVALTVARFEDPTVRERIRTFLEDGVAPWMRGD